MAVDGALSEVGIRDLRMLWAILGADLRQDYIVVPSADCGTGDPSSGVGWSSMARSEVVNKGMYVCALISVGHMFSRLHQSAQYEVAASSM